MITRWCDVQKNVYTTCKLKCIWLKWNVSWYMPSEQLSIFFFFYKSMAWTLFHMAVYELWINQAWHISNSTYINHDIAMERPWALIQVCNTHICMVQCTHLITTGKMFWWIMKKNFLTVSWLSGLLSAEIFISTGEWGVQMPPLTSENSRFLRSGPQGATLVMIYICYCSPLDPQNTCSISAQPSSPAPQNQLANPFGPHPTVTWLALGRLIMF